MERIAAAADEGGGNEFSRSSQALYNTLIQSTDIDDGPPLPKHQRLSAEVTSALEGWCQNCDAAALLEWSNLLNAEYSVGCVFAEFKHFTSNFIGYSDILPKIFLDFINCERRIDPRKVEKMLHRALFLTRKLFLKLQINHCPNLDLSSSTWYWPVTKLPIISALTSSPSINGGFKMFDECLRHFAEYLHALGEGCRFSKASLAFLLPTLSTLTIPGFQLSPERLRSLALYCPQLLTVDFRNCFQVYESESELLYFFKSCRRLQNVNLSGKHNKLNAVQVLPALPRSLRELTIQLKLSEPEDVSRLEIVQIRCPLLEALNITFWRSQSVAAHKIGVTTFFSKFPRLKRLGFNCLHTFTGLKLFPRIPKPESFVPFSILHLEQLIVENFDFSPQKMKAIVNGCGELKELNVSTCAFDGHRGQDLCKLQFLTRLTLYNIDGFDSQVLHQIAKAGRLEYLVLGKLKEDDEQKIDIAIVAVFCYCKGLDYIKLCELKDLTHRPFDVMHEVLEERLSAKDQPTHLSVIIWNCNGVNLDKIPLHRLLTFNGMTEDDCRASALRCIPFSDVCCTRNALWLNRDHLAWTRGPEMARWLSKIRPVQQGMPNEIIAKIFSHLPLAYLIKMERVCKCWKALTARIWARVHLLSFETLFGQANTATPRHIIFREEQLRAIIKRCPCLEELRLEALRNTISSFHVLADSFPFCKNLQVLDLSDIYVPAESLVRLGLDLRNLTDITLHNCLQDKSAPKWLESFLEICRGLKAIDVGGGRRITSCVQVFESLKKDVYSLNVGEVEFMEGAMEQLQTSCPNLERLIMSTHKLEYNRDMPAIKGCLESLTKLHELRLSLSFWRDSKSRLIDIDVGLLVNLSSLTLTGAHLNTETMKSIGLGCTNLKSLDLNGRCSVDSRDGLIALANLPKLTFLDLSDTEIDDDIAVKIAERGILRALLLRWNKGITDTGIVNILRYCQQLNCLDVYSCRNVTRRSLLFMSNIVQARRELFSPSERCKKLDELRDRVFVTVPRAKRTIRALLASDENENMTPFEDFCCCLHSQKTLELHVWTELGGVADSEPPETSDLLVLHDVEDGLRKSPFLKLSHENYRLKSPTYY